VTASTTRDDTHTNITGKCPAKIQYVLPEANRYQVPGCFDIKPIAGFCRMPSESHQTPKLATQKIKFCRNNSEDRQLKETGPRG
jgi:hypothetical protein